MSYIGEHIVIMFRYKSYNSSTITNYIKLTFKILVGSNINIKQKHTIMEKNSIILAMVVESIEFY